MIDPTLIAQSANGLWDTIRRFCAEAEFQKTIIAGLVLAFLIWLARRIAKAPYWIWGLTQRGRGPVDEALRAY
ncbi:MAG: hypothetical protein IID36_11150, partial [Planctomycetes bacterium]|nr:hypothetical protein [Planctomycetota bacterium]